VVNARKTKAGLTGGVHSSAREERGLGTVSGAGGAGPWAASEAGPDRFPRGPFLFLFLLFSFSNSVFLNLSNTFQI
jgi:hypothetical protein